MYINFWLTYFRFSFEQDTYEHSLIVFHVSLSRDLVSQHVIGRNASQQVYMSQAPINIVDSIKIVLDLSKCCAYKQAD